jgi:hypothetical protein
VQAAQKAGEQIRDLISVISGMGTTVVGACVPGGNARLPHALPDILAVHARIHAAEGAFYRDVLADACTQAGLLVSRAPERDIPALAGKALGSSDERLRERLVVLGKSLGPPWGEDQRVATLAAFIALKAN